MKTVTLFVVLAFMISPGFGSQSAWAQPDCTDSDLIGLMFDDGEINYHGGSFLTCETYIVLLNPSISYATAFDVRISVPAGNTLLGLTTPVSSVILGEMPDFYVGFAEPVAATGGSITLGYFSIFLATTNSGDLYLRPVSVAPEIPGSITVMQNALATPVMTWSGDYELPVARLFADEDLVYCETTTDPDVIVDVFCNSYSDVQNRAALASGATDGYDPGLDIPKPGPSPEGYLVTSFRHPDWPLGPRYLTDIRAPFNPMIEAKVWPLRVETDQSGYVQLDFTPNFDPGDGLTLTLRDLSTGQTYDLFPSLTYVYPAVPVHDFELIIGGDEVPPPLDPDYRPLETGWSMVGFPLQPPMGQATLGDVLLDQAPGYAYAFGHFGIDGYELQDNDDAIVPGAGYWLATDTPFDWTMNGDMRWSEIDIDLELGWNLVAYPLWFPGALENVRVKHLTVVWHEFSWADAVDQWLVAATPMDFDPTASQYVEAIDLEPWRGYWFAALTNDVKLSFDWHDFQVLPARLTAIPEPVAPNPQSWRTDLAVAIDDECRQQVTIGVNPEATSGYDPNLDRPLPPASPAGGVSVGILHPEWGLSTGSRFRSDYSCSAQEPVAWDVEIRLDEPGEVSLSWTRHDWPEGVDYELYIPSQNRVVVSSMWEQERVELDVHTGRLTVVVRTPDMMSGVGDLPAVDYSLGTKPNPFNPQTVLYFDLVESGDVEIRIYNVRGELVESLIGTGMTAGRNELTWRGRDNAGREAPSGSYFARLYREGRPVGPVAKMSLIR